MRTLATFFVCLFLLVEWAVAEPKQHVISFGKPATVKWLIGEGETTPVDLKVRPLYVDTRLKEFTIGSPHEITDRLFVVLRAFRVNDALENEPPSPRLWKWQRGGWLVVDRVTGRISPLNLPEFDSYFSSASWYRDYVAYCGITEDGKKVSAMVMQLGRRKPLLKKILGATSDSAMPDSACPTPVWQRQPARATFRGDAEQKFIYAVRQHSLDVVNDEDSEPVE